MCCVKSAAVDMPIRPLTLSGLRNVYRNMSQPPNDEPISICGGRFRAFGRKGGREGSREGRRLKEED